jgi:hypothetical protein
MSGGSTIAVVLLVVGVVASLVSFDRDATGGLACIGAVCAAAGIRLGLAAVESNPPGDDP